MAKLTRDEFISSLKEMTILEIKELVDAMKEEFGVDPSAVAVAAAPAAAALFSCVGGKRHLPHAWQRPCQCVIRHLLRLGGYGPAGGGRGLHSAGKRAGADGSEHRKHPSRL